MNVEGFKKILSNYAIYFHVERPTISKDGNPPLAWDKFALFVSDQPSGTTGRNVLRLFDTRDLSSSINRQGEEDVLNTLFLSLTLVGYEVFVNDQLYTPDAPYVRGDQCPLNPPPRPKPPSQPPLPPLPLVLR